MSNPFLFDEPENAGDVQAEAFLNPFLQEAAVEDEYTAENPFLAQTTSNPFFANDADNAEDATSTVATSAAVEKPVNTEHIDTAMSFFGTTITDAEDEEIESHPTNVNATEDFAKKGPPPRPSPPACPIATQELISTLTDHLDQTSVHLLDRIPVTRTPSPVSMRDLHSPSPTPEMADLLDVSENVNQNDGLIIDHAEDNGRIHSDNPFAGFDDVAPVVAAAEAPPPPVRAAPPPPSRPTPPRPTPPRRPSPPTQNPPQSSQPHEADLFDVFGTNAAAKQQPNVPKSNQDILSLFSAPKVAAAPAKPDDLLTSDIFSMPNDTKPSSNSSAFSDPSANTAPAPVVSTQEDIEQPSIVAAVVEDHLDLQQVETPSPTNDAVAATTNLPINTGLDFTAEIDKCESLSDNSSAIGSTMSRTPEVATPYYVPGGYIENRGQSPVSHGDIAYAYQDESIKAASMAANNPFGSPEQPAMPIINHHVEQASIVINKTADEFDAFSAKFNSASNAGVDAFGSGFKSPAPPTDGKYIIDVT